MRSRAGTSDHFDLFPFISILLCTLGTLLYITLIMAAVSIGPGAGEGWIPMVGKGAPIKKPLLLEWDGTTVLVHGDHGYLRIPWAESHEIRIGTQVFHVRDSDSMPAALDSLLGVLQNERATRYALLVVRPSGFGSFNHIANEFRRREIDIGYEPMDQWRPVRLLKARTP